MEPPEQSNPCAICLGAMCAGGGEAIFTAECSHTFHFNCISTSVAQGRRVCPLCNTQWRELPSLLRPLPLPSSMPPTLPRQPFPRMEPMHGVQPPPPRHQPVPAAQPPPPQPVEPEVFDDDDPVDPPVSGHDGQRREAAAATSGPLVVKTHVECSAVARDSSPDNFAVLVHVKAPGIVCGAASGDDAPRAPLDLVTVLDVSGSMRRGKLALQAMGFVIDTLGPDDRLSVVSFSSTARRVTRLLRMSDTIGKGLASEAVGSLTACGGTNIADGLRTAAKVLDDRRCRNAVSSVILLSDGRDNHNIRRTRDSVTNYDVLVPPSFVPTGAVGDWSAPIHTFGFGHNHDAAAMHAIAEATGGTFSYIENEEAIQDAFAQCVGGLLTVVAQDARLDIASVHPGVRITSVKSGRYENRVDEDGRSASVAVGELYADEERRFLLFLSVPTADAADGETPLISVRCSFREAAGGSHVDVAAEDAVVSRPEDAADAERSAEVERERVRVAAVEDIAAARAAAERGAHGEAAQILGSRRRSVARSAAARGGDGDPASAALGRELRRMCKRVATRESYRESGRAYVLAGLSSHEQQRATSRQLRPLRQDLAGCDDGGGGEAMSSVVADFARTPSAVGAIDPEAMDMGGGCELGGAAGTSSAAAAKGASENEEGATSSYLTPAMRAMLLRSRRAREAAAERQPQQSEAAEEAGSSESRKCQTSRDDVRV
ncbi:unnamed protein product [Urochloa decumbens]|uniref:Uncharacterized protein n=1 Tax=Urochloa decumbens TaxID=240449 RepID=A0ABC8Y850_9POAL